MMRFHLLRNKILPWKSGTGSSWGTRTWQEFWCSSEPTASLSWQGRGKSRLNNAERTKVLKSTKLETTGVSFKDFWDVKSPFLSPTLTWGTSHTDDPRPQRRCWSHRPYRASTPPSSLHQWTLWQKTEWNVSAVMLRHRSSSGLTGSSSSELHLVREFQKPVSVSSVTSLRSSSLNLSGFFWTWWTHDLKSVC